MIEVYVTMGYSGAYLFHWKNHDTGEAKSAWVPRDTAYDVFKRSEYWERILDAWKIMPVNTSKSVKSIELVDGPSGELRGLIEKLKETLDS